jgi:hypothetical protein
LDGAALGDFSHGLVRERSSGDDDVDVLEQPRDPIVVDPKTARWEQA